MSNDIRDRLQEVAQAVQVRLPPFTGFIVMAFDFGPGGRLEYCSNARREDVVRALREFIQKSESGWMQHKDDGPPAPGQPVDIVPAAAVSVVASNSARHLREMAAQILSPGSVGKQFFNAVADELDTAAKRETEAQRLLEACLETGSLRTDTSRQLYLDVCRFLGKEPT